MFLEANEEAALAREEEKEAGTETPVAETGVRKEEVKPVPIKGADRAEVVVVVAVVADA